MNKFSRLPVTLGIALFALACAFGGLIVPASALGASIAEPSTVFYGKIIGTSAAQPFPITDGTIEWKIRRADGRELALRANLFPLQGGAYSYRLSVPHEALANGLEASFQSVPLSAAPQNNGFTGILVNGKAARIIGGSENSLVAAQALRAATYQMDLEVPLSPLDSDGDGIPDWWAQKYGLDKLTGNDPDGDGLSNLQEYLLGSDPTRGNGSPTLVTTELEAYAEATTGVMLRTIDSDSAPEALVYTLKTEPEVGALLLENSPLKAGAKFTQKDVTDGRLLFSQSGGADSGSFEVSVQDETPAHAAGGGVVRVRVYRPSTALLGSLSSEQLLSKALANEPVGTGDAEEQQRVRNYLLGKAGFVIWDGSSERADQHIGGSVLPDRARVLIGGSGEDELTGSSANDVLIGRGANDVLRGGDGADRFEFQAGDTGHDTVADFNATDGDVIDISHVLNGTSALLENYVRLGSDAGNTTLNISANGSGTGFSDLVITLAGVPYGTTDLHTLLDGGNLVTGDLQVTPRVTLAVTRADASENGPENGEFTLTRSGSAAGPLVVQISVGGSAANGVDYSKIGNTVTFAAGAKTASLIIAPFPDTQTEPAETVELVVLPGDGYELGASTRASLTIEDAQIFVNIEAIEPVAAKDPLMPGAFLVRRSGIVDRSALVRLDIGGSAQNGTDYQSLLRFINFAPGQDTALIEVQPKAGSVLPPEGKTVQVSILSDPAYKVGSNSKAIVTILDHDGTFAAWRAQMFPGVSGALQAFANADPAGTGVPAVLQYAFGLDPSDPGKGQLPRVYLKDGHLFTEFWRRSDAADLDYEVAVSSDLVHWDVSGASLQNVALDTASVDSHLARYKAVSGMGDENRLFINVRVRLKP